MPVTLSRRSILIELTSALRKEVDRLQVAAPDDFEAVDQFRRWIAILEAIIEDEDSASRSEVSSEQVSVLAERAGVTRDDVESFLTIYTEIQHIGNLLQYKNVGVTAIFAPSLCDATHNQIVYGACPWCGCIISKLK